MGLVLALITLKINANVKRGVNIYHRLAVTFVKYISIEVSNNNAQIVARMAVMNFLFNSILYFVKSNKFSAY